MAKRVLPAFFALAVLAGATAAPGELVVTRTSRPVRLLRTWEETVKTAGGGEYLRRVDVVFDYRKGTAREDFYDKAGRFTGSRRITQVLPSPSPEEMAEAFSLVRSDLELQTIMTRLSADLTGGFVVEEGKGKPCGPGTRCLLVLVISGDHSGLIRRVVVDLARERIAYRTFDPAEHGGVK
jgi:hypothetical protein